MEQCLCLFYVLDLFRNRRCECVIKRMRKNMKSNNNDFLDGHTPHTRPNIRKCLLFGSHFAQAASPYHMCINMFENSIDIRLYVRLSLYFLFVTFVAIAWLMHVSVCCVRAILCLFTLLARRPNFGSAFAYFHQIQFL